MKALATIAVVMVVTLVHASSGCLANAEKFVCVNKVILQFNHGTSEEQQASFFKGSSLLLDISGNIVLQYPPVIIARLKTPAANYSELKQVIGQLQSDPEVRWVNPVFRVGKDEIAVLNEIFVKVKNPVSETILNHLAAEYQFQITGRYSFDRNIFIITPLKNASFNSMELSCEINDMDAFDYVHPNLLFCPVVMTNDLLFNRQWNINNEGSSIQGSGTLGADMSVEEAWTITRGDSSIKIAILDSGVDTVHVDLVDNMLPGFDATGGGSNGYPNTNYANDAHGTACAGIAAAVSENGAGIAGAAPLCKIIPVKIFYYVDTALGPIDLGVIPYSTTQWMADGIHWAMNAGAHVMSNSWGVPSALFSILPGPVSLAEDAIREATSSGRNGLGIPMLFSTGNENTNPIWPSTLEETIAVTATSMCDERKSPFSCDGEDWGGNYDGALDIAAPGVRITTTDLPGSKGFAGGSYTFDFNGTSAACPNAAGVMALILSVNQGVKAWDAKYLLASTADKVGGYNYDQTKYAGTWSRELGFGRVNAYSAVLAAQNYMGIESVEQKSPLSIYPNPVVSGQFVVEFRLRRKAGCTISIMDISGKLNTSQKFSLPAGFQQIKMNTQVHSGMYLIMLQTDQERHYQKLLFLGE